MKQLNLNEIKQCELELLKKFAEYCDENNLCYTLAGGTLLGAIRHKGFIPWDDDIDVMMPRSDYLKFQELQKRKPTLICKSISDQTSGNPFTKILDENTVIESEYATDEETDHLWIDVFPLDGMPTNKVLLKLQFLIRDAFRWGILWSKAKIGKGTTWFRKIIKLIFVFPAKLIGAKRFSKWLEQYCMLWKMDKYDQMGGLVWGYGPQESMPKKEWLQRVKVEFEGHEFWAPGCWDLYLTNLYGDYMQLPPEEKRVTHNMVAYIKE